MFNNPFQFMARNGNEVVKRDITLIDETATQVVMTLWGEQVFIFYEIQTSSFQAKDFDDEGVGHAIGIKGALVREFNGNMVEIDHLVAISFNSSG